jgi:hypothetical protein
VIFDERVVEGTEGRDTQLTHGTNDERIEDGGLFVGLLLLFVVQDSIQFINPGKK